MPNRNFQLTRISTGTFIRFFAVILAFVGLYLIRDVLIALFFAVIVASALEPAIGWLKERGVPRILGVVLLYLGIALILFFVVYLFFPLVLDELQNASVSYPAVQRQLISGIEKFSDLPFSSLISQNLGAVLNAPINYVQKLGGGVFDLVSVIFGGVLSSVLIVVFSFYLAAQEKGIETFLRLVTPLSQEKYIIDLWSRSQRKLGRWLRSQLLLCAMVGVLIFFGLTFLGVNHALLFAVLASLFEIIPVAGPILAAVPAVITAFLSSTTLGVFTVLLYVAIQQTESHVIVPVVMKKTIGLSPLVVVLALLIGAEIGGIFGILLAVPITAILAEFVDDWDRKKRELIPE